MDTQVESAINLAFDPRTEQNLKAQAYEFLNHLRADPSGWQVCLSLFTRTPPTSEVVRLVCLEIVNTAVQAQGLDHQSLCYVRDSLMGYIKQRYSLQSSEGPDSSSIQNKLTQTITYLFTSLYAEEWPSIFDDFRSLADAASEIGTTNPPATIMYLRVVGSVHDEIADVLIPRSADEQKRANDLKDIIRARDVNKIAASWQEILARWRQIDLGIVEMCLRTIAKWVSWTDISLVIDQTIQNALLELAGQQGNFSSDSREAKSRDAAIDTFTETVGKKMQPHDKIELIRYLNLGSIVGQLIHSPALADMRSTPDYDTDLAETVAKLVNNVAFDIVKVLDTESVNESTKSKANDLLQTFVPYILRFFSDEYDEICSVVIPSLTDLLTTFRKQRKSKAVLPPQWSAMLQPILDAIVLKMKYDETTNWGEEDDETDEAEFQELRRKLHVLQQAVAAVDEDLYSNTLSSVVASTFNRLDTPDNKPDWRDLDLALHEMYLFGELAVKNQGLYTKSNPTTAASQTLIEMISKMVDSGLATYPHPAIQLQYMEICERYVQFFEHNTSRIPIVLENFVNFVHSNHAKIRTRSWYLFLRLVKHLRSQLGDVTQTILQAISDLLVINAEVQQDNDGDDDSSENNDQSADAIFNSQLFLFEAIGCVSSTNVTPLETKVSIARRVIEPLGTDLSQHLPLAKAGDERAILQVHHIVMALGTLANGFSDWTPGQSTGSPPPEALGAEFGIASEAVLMALSDLKQSMDIRTAARHSFSRFMGVLGARILPQLPRWIDGLLSNAGSNDEMAMFLRLLAQVIYGFKSETYDILDQLLLPLLQRIFAGFTEPTTGTDDEIQLKELKSQYLSFLSIVLSNELASVLISPANQGNFDAFISTLTHFASDPADPITARSALAVISKMTAIWGGPDVALDSTADPSPALPGFDSFILSQFAPIPWTLISSPGFAASDAQTRSVLQEAAGLQWTILRKTGSRYREQLQRELQELGANEEGVQQYLQSISGDSAGFRKFFASFIQQAKR
ncbi:Xpo1-domain-containing protein [Polychaeton citri CBS 116435]|uniref:Exportin-T n=1 Tax=Polychaeton citri CBS 116435 TaxID=1314669 RepID=A0A9P4UNM1_9PEZI|nr:Xpo1-domain-containing protein [Polychaeton citri CBS 116435]